MPMDCTYRLRIPHRAGQLAKVSTRICEYGGLIGDVSTIAIARHEALPFFASPDGDDGNAMPGPAAAS